MATQNHPLNSPRGDAGAAFPLPLPGPEEYQQLLADCKARFQPANPHEAFLVERLASHLWRMRRINAMETAVLHAAHAKVRARAAASRRQTSAEALLAEAYKSKEVQDMLDVVSRQADLLSRGMERTLRLLTSRAGIAVPPTTIRPRKRPAAK